MRTTLVWFSLIWIGGITIGVAHVSHEKVLVLASLFFIVCLLLSRASRPLIVALTCAFLLGTMWGSSPLSSSKTVTTCKSSQPFEGTIEDRPVYTGIQARFFFREQTGCIYLLYVESSDVLLEGDQIRVTGKVQQLSDISGDDTSFRDYLSDHGAVGVIRGEAIVLHSHPSWLQHVRLFLVQRLYTLFPEPEGSLAAAMIFDERGGLSQSLQDEFRITGTSHILAISGSNITFLAAILLLLFLFIPIHPWARTFIILSLMWLYVVLIGLPVSAVRATVLWTVALIAFRLAALVSLTSVMLLAVTLMVSFNPSLLTDIGFQLSVAAVGGIGLTLFLTNRLLQDNRTISGIDLLLSSVGAFLFTWPLVMYHFGTLSWIGLIANIFIVPLMSVLYFLMIVMLGLDFITHLGARILGGVAHLLWLAIHFLTGLFARIPYGYIEHVSLPVVVIVVYYIFLIGISSYMLTSQRRSWRELWQ